MPSFFKNKLALGSTFIFFFALILGLTATMDCGHDKMASNNSGEAQMSSEQDLYSDGVQKVFNARCIACHSCFDSPCQLNLQSYDGLARGLKDEDVYDGSRAQPVDPTRMFEDAQSTKEWRAKGFHDVIGNSKNSVLLNAMTVIGRVRPKLAPKESRSCISQDKTPEVNNQNAQLAMPYGLPDLEHDKVDKVFQWVSAGAPKPAAKSPVRFSSEAVASQVQTWQEFFNQQDAKSKLVSRYLYEHLYLGHLYFAESNREFLKLIRSETECANPKIISKKHPNDYPKTATFDPEKQRIWYCFVNEQSAIVSKTHMPYMLSAEKMAWFKSNFYGTNWTVSEKELPDYRNETATNPFETFKQIPIQARYKFLLENSQYFIMNFIKGPVCNGTVAVDVIQEQFHVFFMDPDSDLMVRSQEYADAVREHTSLPGKFGSDLGKTDIAASFKDYAKNRDIYEAVERDQLKKLSPSGLSLSDIWDGDGKNDNAVVTVFRHNDSAAVMKGARGDVSKTTFVLDYSTFERIYYNLVVNFNVFGNLGHQLLTRFYMDILRMDSEDNFLYFLPKEQRAPIKKYWYQPGMLTKLQMAYFKEFEFPDIKTLIPFVEKNNLQVELVRRILFERLNSQARGPDDVLNWKLTKQTQTQDPIESQLKTVAGVHGKEKPFAQFFPDMSYLIIPAAGAEAAQVYSIVHNKEHARVAWVVESGRVPEEDSLTIERGYYGSYPNMFFTIRADKQQQLSKMVQTMTKIKSEKDYQAFQKEYGVDRMDPQIWTLYDTLVQDYAKVQPVDAGYLDLSRYTF